MPSSEIPHPENHKQVEKSWGLQIFLWTMGVLVTKILPSCFDFDLEDSQNDSQNHFELACWFTF